MTDAGGPQTNKDERFGVSGRQWALAAVLLMVAIAVGVRLTPRKHQHGRETFGYVGPDKCRKCHEEQFKDWAQTRMARSFEVLKPGTAPEAKRLASLDVDGDYTHDEGCLPCHTTGYGLEGGFVSIETTPSMAGVTCEACHGPGGGYAGTIMSASKPRFLTAEATARGLQYPPKEEVCGVCHNESSPFVGMDYVFDFKERVSRGTHHHYPLKYEHGEQR